MPKNLTDEKLREEINADRIAHGKKPLKEKDNTDDRDDNDGNAGSGQMNMNGLKEQKQSTTDPESGWFHKGEHKEVFAYSIETACDENGWISSITVYTREMRMTAGHFPHFMKS